MDAQSLPNNLIESADRFAARENLELAEPARRVLALSDFAQRVAAQQRHWFLESIDQRRFEAPLGEAQLIQELADAATAADSVDEHKRRFRRLRNRYQLWLVWRHLSGAASLEETTTTLSLMADRFIGAALDASARRESNRAGEPQGAESGDAQQLVVFGLGKLGGRELNLSSDIDLIFAYPEEGRTTAGYLNQQYFTRLGQGLIDLLHPVTADGFVFRVDMRLRPYGASGPLVMHFGAIQQYFEATGRSWERYALLKARACAGDIERGEELLASLKPFVYRRYLDFGSLESMREMKARLAAERHKPDNVKLGPGGIRYAEFAVQVQQLILGGRHLNMQKRGFLEALAELGKTDHFDAGTTAELRDAYRFLRDTEHCIQAEADRQTQELPVTELSRSRLAYAMGFDSYTAFLSTLADHRDNVERIFDRVVGAESPRTEGGLWEARQDRAQLAEAGFDDTRQVVTLLDDLATARDRSSVGDEGRRRLDALMPEVLQITCRQAEPVRALQRLVPILKSLLRRSTYLALLRENPEALQIFVRLAGQSRWVAEQLASQSTFMEVLLDKHAWDLLSGRDSLVDELDAALADAEDEEALVDGLRVFKEQRVFRVAVAETRGLLPIMHVSDYLSWLAEAVLEHAIGIAWDQCAKPSNAASAPHKQHNQSIKGTSPTTPTIPDSSRSKGSGGPPVDSRGRAVTAQDAATATTSPAGQRRPFIAVGYGKLGGLELGPDSDLDIVFIHDLPASEAQFLHRLVRRLMHLLTIRTYAGPLYNIDMRLRPSGNAGPLVSSLKAFLNYQNERAWVWEHQALVRARAVAGDPTLIEEFEAARRELLCRPRPIDELRKEVTAMRKRIEAHHGDTDLKRGRGGVVDVEFIAQFLVLAWAHQHPNLAKWSDNVRILEEAGMAGVLAEEVSERLVLAYLALRGEGHRRSLDLTESTQSDAALTVHREIVCETWEKVFKEPRPLATP